MSDLIGYVMCYKVSTAKCKSVVLNRDTAEPLGAVEGSRVGVGNSFGFEGHITDKLGIP